MRGKSEVMVGGGGGWGACKLVFLQYFIFPALRHSPYLHACVCVCKCLLLFAILEFIIKYFVCNSLLDFTFGSLSVFATLRKKRRNKNEW